MMTEFLTQHTWLWPLAWQSTTALSLGLAASFLLRRRPVRAHQLLLWALIAAVAVPALSHWVKRQQWGLLQSSPTATQIDIHPIFVTPTPSNPERAVRPATTAGPTAMTQRPATTDTSSVPPIPWERLLLPLWISVSTALLVRLAVRFLLGFHLARRSRPCDNEAVEKAVTTAKAKLAIAGCVSVRSSNGTRSPVIWCWGTKPILLVSAEANDDIDWPSVVCHELAHWKRRDHLSGLWAECLVCLLPWHPLSWLAQRRLVRLSEEACDDWVIAAGQIGTRYARTLLGLTPQGRAALVPAVVSSKKGLATRIRRILAGECTCPRSGLHWSLTITALTAILAIGVALAQAGPAKSTGTVRTELPHGAVIEQSVSAKTITGLVLAPNGDPMRESWTHITIPPMTCYAVTPDPNGHFEIPWSSSWIDAGQPVYLVARDTHQALARIIEIEDPAKPITIQLEPAKTIAGKVLDANGRPIRNAAVALALPVEFECRTPIAGATSNEQGEFTIEAVPGGQSYATDIRAEGYAAKRFEITIPKRGNEPIRVVRITLEPQDLVQTAIPVPGPDRVAHKTFDAIYRLDDGEVVKFIKVPFARSRQAGLIDSKQWVYDLLYEASCMVRQWRWDGKLEGGSWFSDDRGSYAIYAIMTWFLDIPTYEIGPPEEFLRTPLGVGDWIVRKDATTEQKIRALEQIIVSELQRSIRFEKRQVECDTIVVTGRYAFAPLPSEDPSQLCIAAKSKDRLSNDEVDSLSELLAWLAPTIGIPIDNRTETTETGKIQYLYDWRLLQELRTGARDRENDLPLLLENLAQQTGLTFTVEKRPTDVWFISEKTQKERG